MYSYLPVPGNTEGVGRHFGTFILLEQTGSRIAQVQTEVAISGLCQQIDTYRIDIHVFAHSLLFSAVDVGERFYAVADFKLRPSVEEERVVAPFLPFHRDRDLEEKVAQMQQISANSSPEIVERFRKTGKVGSFLHVLGKETEGYLAPARESARGIAPLFGIDASTESMSYIGSPGETAAETAARFDAFAKIDRPPEESAE